MKKYTEKIFGFSCCYYLWIVLLVLQIHSFKIYSQNDLKKFNYHNKLYFIENKGQWDNDVLYLYKALGMDVWITKRGLNLTLYKLERNEKDEEGLSSRYDSPFRQNEDSLTIHRFVINFENSNNLPTVEGKHKLAYYHNYFISNDSKKHVTKVSLYKEVIIKNIYEGIDVKFYFDNGLLRYDFIVNPYADVSQIKFKIKGSFDSTINELNQLYIETFFGKLLIKDLHTFQSGELIPSQFIKTNDCWQIDVGSYDKSKVLIIDPIIYSTFIGGSFIDQAQSMVLDSLGNMYITGTTWSIDYDTTAGVIQNYNAGNYDVFCTKLNSNGSDLIFSTYIGGSKADFGYDICLDKFGYIYLTGNTNSSDFIITPGAYQSSILNTNESDCFITKINPLADSIIYSTYLGGERMDKGIRIKTDDNGNAYVAGITTSWQFDITPGAFQINGGYPYTFGGCDLFITKLNPTGTGLVYSTYLGVYGSPDYFADIELDNNNCVYVLGSTVAHNFYTTPGAYQTSMFVNNGFSDAFVFKLNKTGTACVYSTYFGGDKEDYTKDLAIDKDGNIYILGTTNSIVFPITPGAINEADNNYTKIYIAKLDSSLSTLKASAKFGSNNMDYVSSVQVDSSGNIWILGNTMATNYPVTSSAIQSSHHGSNDIFLTQLNPDFSRITYSTFIGGSSFDESIKLIYDKENTFYILGNSYSPNFPLTDSAYQNFTGAGAFDVVALKVCVSPFNLLTTDDSENQNICLYSPIQSIIYETQGAFNVTVDGLPAGVNVEVINDSIILSGVPIESGNFTYTLTITNSCEIIERSGNINIYDCSAITEDENDDLIKIYPNPTNGILFIESSMDDSFEIYNAMGRLIDKFELTDLTLSLQLNYSSGVYFIRSTNRNKVYKIVLNN